MYHYSSWVNHIEEFDCRSLDSAKCFPLILFYKILNIKFLMLQSCSEHCSRRMNSTPSCQVRVTGTELMSYMSNRIRDSSLRWKEVLFPQSKVLSFKIQPTVLSRDWKKKKINIILKVPHKYAILHDLFCI